MRLSTSPAKSRYTGPQRATRSRTGKAQSHRADSGDQTMSGLRPRSGPRSRAPTPGLRGVAARRRAGVGSAGDRRGWRSGGGVARAVAPDERAQLAPGVLRGLACLLRQFLGLVGQTILELVEQRVDALLDPLQAAVDELADGLELGLCVA